MFRSAAGIAARVIGVVGIVGATMLQGVAAHATDRVSFLSCTTPAPSSTPTATPATAPPSATPAGTPQPTQTPDNCVPTSGTVVSDFRTMRFSAQTDTFQ